MVWPLISRSGSKKFTVNCKLAYSGCKLVNGFIQFQWFHSISMVSCASILAGLSELVGLEVDILLRCKIFVTASTGLPSPVCVVCCATVMAVSVDKTSFTKVEI